MNVTVNHGTLHLDEVTANVPVVMTTWTFCNCKSNTGRREGPIQPSRAFTESSHIKGKSPIVDSLDCEGTNLFPSLSLP
jgi:hypothetical protein